MTKETYTLRLMNGSELDGILESEPPKTIISDRLRLDTTSQYLTVGAMPKTLFYVISPSMIINGS